MHKIIKATLKELKPLAELFDDYRIFYKKDPDRSGAERFIAERIINNDAEIFIFLDEKHGIIGFTQLYPLFSSTRMRRLWLLNDLYVNETQRGKGVAIALIEKAKQHCRFTNACGLILETAKDNLVGNALYIKTGFELDQEHNYYSWA